MLGRVDEVDNDNDIKPTAQQQWREPSSRLLSESCDSWGNESIGHSVLTCGSENFAASDDGGAANSHAPSHHAQKPKKSRVARFVYIVLAIDALSFGLVTYFRLSAVQSNKFRSEFDSYSRETAEIAESNAQRTFGQFQSLATTITSVGLQDDKDAFPNKTVPHFERRAREICDLTGAEMVAWLPFVERAHVQGWEEYSNANQPGWLLQDDDENMFNRTNNSAAVLGSIHNHIYNYTSSDDELVVDARRGFVDTGFMQDILTGLGYNAVGLSAPVAQFGPAPRNASLLKLDLYSHPTVKKEIVASLEYNVPVISEVQDLEFLLSHIDHDKGGGNENDQTSFDYSELRSFTLDAVKEDFTNNAKTVGFLLGVVPWRTFFYDLLPDTINGIVVKVVSDCGRNFTYVVNGGKDDLAFDGEYRDTRYESMMQQYQFFWKEHPKGTSRHCHFDLFVSPSDEFAALYESNAPILVATAVVAVFAFTAFVFYLYDTYVQKAQVQLQNNARRSSSIVKSLFPKHVEERLMQEAQTGGDNKSQFASDDDNDLGLVKALADLYPNTTVLFADIVGFTAWSSSRDPSQVFTLLETIYGAFDRDAKRMRVFKVETVGDCYVAVTGVPQPQANHAVIMARFSQKCLDNFNGLVKKDLARELGAGTETLGLRLGLHSGQVTAGVLRGERARFQLFGDTVNTAARMESTGKRNAIQISKETGELLRSKGNGHWISPREDVVNAKGKGELDTFWLSVRSRRGTKPAGRSGRRESPKVAASDLTGCANPNQSRLMDWSVDTLSSFLKDIAKRRAVTGIPADPLDKMAKAEADQIRRCKGKTVLDEVAEVVEVTSYNANATIWHVDTTGNDFQLETNVVVQLRTLVEDIFAMYKDNPFHNFEHACQVASSANNLLSRIVAPSGVRDHTHGITSDPLTLFTIVLSALLHDVDHGGVPNTTLVAEKSAIAQTYNNKSVAEQNSVDLAWNLLMNDRFEDLRRAIYCTESEFARFRQLLVNTILATDVMDKELKNMRNSRWSKAFAQPKNRESKHIAENREATIVERVIENRKATVVIENLILASDVLHTMQHWNVYRKWNEKLFKELYRAYKGGRSDTDPSTTWYQGELGFFDGYVIPLAKKLKICGVFGESSEEFLGHAEHNRRVWEARGQELVEDMLNNIDQEVLEHSTSCPDPRGQELVETVAKHMFHAEIEKRRTRGEVRDLYYGFGLQKFPSRGFD